MKMHGTTVKKNLCFTFSVFRSRKAPMLLHPHRGQCLVEEVVYL